MKAAQVQGGGPGGVGGGSQPPLPQQENSNETMSPQPPDSFPSQSGDLSPSPNSNHQQNQSQVRKGTFCTFLHHITCIMV